MLQYEPVQSTPVEIENMWLTHDRYIYRCDEPIYSKPNFYPLYNYNNLYSFSLMPLICYKRSIKINNMFVEKYMNSDFDVAGADCTIDQDIKRIGEPYLLDQSIGDKREFIYKLIEAMQNDVEAVIKNNPGKTNFILCGGKDSLNLLLLEWSTPVVAVSAEPNFPLVSQFVKDNGIGIEVRKLEDLCPELSIEREIAEASCLVDLSHWRWTTHLRKISDQYNNQVVFWKGQVADAFLTDYWMAYTSSISKKYKVCRRAYRRLSQFAPGMMEKIFGAYVIKDFQQSLWQRAAVAQGAHLGFLRSICNALVLSAYHGRETTKVLHSINLNKLTRNDLRPDIGEALLGRPVKYPLINPAPLPSAFRAGLRTLPRYIEALNHFGVLVVR